MAKEKAVTLDEQGNSIPTPKRRPAKRRPLFLVGVRGFAEDGAELPVVRYEIESVTRDATAVLDLMSNRPGLPYIKVDVMDVN